MLGKSSEAIFGGRGGGLFSPDAEKATGARTSKEGRETFARTAGCQGQAVWGLGSQLPSLGRPSFSRIQTQTRTRTLAACEALGYLEVPQERCVFSTPRCCPLKRKVRAPQIAPSSP